MSKIQPRFPQVVVPNIKSAHDVGPLLSRFSKQIDAQYGVIAKVINDGAVKFLTADLPPASKEMDGQVLVEQDIGGNLNLIIYGNGHRARIPGALF